MESLLISACFLGINCKYDGGHNALPEEILDALRARYRLVPACPETAGGLPIPREPCERRGGSVCTRGGRDVSAEYDKGAAAALDLAQREGCRLALLKERSPSCGHEKIYDGSFTGKLVPGDGVTAEKLKQAGIAVCGESEIQALL